MKKIINGKVYDTDTARSMGSWDNGYLPNDFYYVEEVLYRKKTGEHFLRGYGGGNSSYGVWHGNSGGPGEKIIPLSLEDAMRWAEKHLDGDDYIAAFGAPDEGDGTKVILNLSVSTATKAALEQLRAETGKSISQLIDDLIAKL